MQLARWKTRWRRQRNMFVNSWATCWWLSRLPNKPILICERQHNIGVGDSVATVRQCCHGPTVFGNRNGRQKVLDALCCPVRGLSEFWSGNKATYAFFKPEMSMILHQYLGFYDIFVFRVEFVITPLILNYFLGSSPIVMTRLCPII